MVMIGAVLAGPILAVQVSRWLDDRKERRQRRLAIFRTLMASRAGKLSASHVEALNLIDVEFYGVRQVTLAWNAYLDHLNNRAMAPDAWSARVDDLFFDLLQRIAVELDYDFDKVHIKNQNYQPSAHINLENDQHELRQGIIKLLRGQIALPMHIVPESKPLTELPDARRVPALPEASPPHPNSYEAGEKKD